MVDATRIAKAMVNLTLRYGDALVDMPRDVIDELIAEELGIHNAVEVTEITDMNAYLNQRAQKAGLIAKCLHPECDKVVDRRKQKSGCCCKAHMNYQCTHPDCVQKAVTRGWKRYTHPFGTKIAAEHWEYRKR